MRVLFQGESSVGLACKQDSAPVPAHDHNAPTLRPPGPRSDPTSAHVWKKRQTISHLEGAHVEREPARLAHMLLEFFLVREVDDLLRVERLWVYGDDGQVPTRRVCHAGLV